MVKQYHLCLNVFYSFSFIIPTDNAPKIRRTPANTSMFTSGGTFPGVVNILRIQPPATAATICGIHIVQLNSPKYVPMCPPVSAFVRIVKGRANMAAHAHPIKRNDTKRTY